MGRSAAKKAAQRLVWSVILVLSGIKKMSAADNRSSIACTASTLIQIRS